MPKIYSVDLRQKVIQALGEGSTAVDLCKVFNLSRKTIYNWQKQFRKTGSLQASKSGRKFLTGKIQDLHSFKNFVNSKPDRSSEEMAQEWGGVSSATIRRYLKIIGFTNKKNIWLQEPLRDKT